ncbi:hypothetical protein [Candidatus Magnetobacterium casense]|uniref:Uncharacterized protein n=1 Tax=Candidatus Magnetobacterium casense TaxID=1455061 RepID=A0ABS6S1S2_9BACT|nr:hypothetical protein [Candidatus Magnetobacterium casensis]MBV6342779.1 hypothetical protein [Candidatus Magnetobacterium casensis]
MLTRDTLARTVLVVWGIEVGVLAALCALTRHDIARWVLITVLVMGAVFFGALLLLAVLERWER